MEEIMNMLIKLKLTPNQFYVMWAIEDGVTTPILNTPLELKNVRNKGYLAEDGGLTEEGAKIVKDVSAIFKGKKKKANKVVMGTDYEENIKTYNELFPKKKLNTGKFARSSKKNLEIAFRWFFDNYDYSWETVHKATRMYCNDRELVNWDYTMNNTYFIRKGEQDKTFKSALSDFCQAVEDGLDEAPQAYFKDNVF